jgi:hypothetical protein
VAKGVPGQTVTGPADAPLSFSHDPMAPFAPGVGTFVQDTIRDNGPAEAKAIPSEAAPGTYEDREFDISGNNGSMTFKASWPNHYIPNDTVADALNDAVEAATGEGAGGQPNDIDLKIYRQVDGVWEQLGSAATDNSGGPSETGVIPTPPAGHYRLRVENWASVDRDWTADITFTQGTSSPGIPPSTESWTLDCIVGGSVIATRQVTVARGEAVDVGNACPATTGKKPKKPKPPKNR